MNSLVDPTVAAFGIVSGSILIPTVLIFFNGDIDPFGHGGPLCLEGSSLILALFITLWFRCPFASATGIYTRLLGTLFATGVSKYPMSSVIALGVHGLLPAITGSVITSVGLYVIKHRINNSHS